MAIFRFKRLTESKKSALILVKANKFQMSWTPAYVPASAVDNMQENEEGHLPDGYTLAPIPELDENNQPVIDEETGEAKFICAKDGSPLHTLVWK